VAEFPTLKTGAVAQYPLQRTLTYSTDVVQFLDGSEQRFPNFGAPLRRWLIRLDQLDETEAAELAQFFEDHPANATFAFTDPLDGATYANCSIDQNDFVLTLNAESWAGLNIVIRENRP
jgi:phage-related protein